MLVRKLVHNSTHSTSQTKTTSSTKTEVQYEKDKKGNTEAKTVESQALDSLLDVLSGVSDDVSYETVDDGQPDPGSEQANKSRESGNQPFSLGQIFDFNSDRPEKIRQRRNERSDNDSKAQV